MPEIATTQVMQFHSDAVDDGDLLLTALNGVEAISKPYEFTLEFASTKPDISAADMLANPAWVGIRQGVRMAGSNQRAATTLKIHGVLQSFEQIGKELELVKYRAVLVPKLQRLAMTHQSHIFQEMKVPEIIKEVCARYDIEVDDSKLGSYDVRDYVVQYEETDLAFLHRWMQHEGIFYYFQQAEEHEKLVLADTPEGYGAMQGDNSFSYKPIGSDGTGVEDGDSDDADNDWFKVETIRSFASRTSILPQKVVLNDYNWQDPSTSLKAEAEVSSAGVGTVYRYNSHYRTESQGDRLAKIRAEEINCREIMLTGNSDGRGFRAGLVFALKDHYRASMNADYLITEVRHTATQPVALGSANAGATYGNVFAAVPKSKHFRPVFDTPWPQIKGVMHARIDGSDGSTPYAQLDDKGRYKVRMPIDMGDSGEGSASKYVRKQEAYAGPNQGMHFPLLKESEVLLTHIDGNPDRPMIQGAVFNSNTPNVVAQANQTQNRILTPGQNQLIMDDTVDAQKIQINTKDDKNIVILDAAAGSEAISIKCTVASSVIRLGKGQGESAGAVVTSADGAYIGTSGQVNVFSTGSNLNMESGAHTNIQVGANKTETIVGNYNLTIAGNEVKMLAGEKSDWTSGNVIKGHAGTSTALVGGLDTKCVGGGKTDIVSPFDNKVVVGVKSELVKGMKLTIGKSTEKKIFQGASKNLIAAKWETEALDSCKITSAAGAVTITAATKISLKCGGSLIELTPGGIKIKSAGSRTTLGSSMTQMKAPAIKIKAQGALECKGTPGGQYK